MNMKNKKNNISSRSRGGNDTLVKPKETDGAGTGAGEEKILLDLINLIKKKINKRLHKI